MNERNRYFQELTLNLQREGFTVNPETKDGLLPVELEGRHLCFALETGAIRYREEDVAGDIRSAALNKATGITRTTAEYMCQMESAPQLNAGSLSGDYRLLAEFNGTVLAGHPTKYGAQFITWEQTADQTSLFQGHYYGPGTADIYIAAQQDFAVRSGLIPACALFTPEQQTEIYRNIQAAMENEYPRSEEQKSAWSASANRLNPQFRTWKSALSARCVWRQRVPHEESGMKFS